jgi:hypothetical protein
MNVNLHMRSSDGGIIVSVTDRVILSFIFIN